MGQPNAAWPTKPFYILSKQVLNGISDWTLTVGQNNSLSVQRQNYEIDQLWQAVASPSGGAFLQNLGTGLVLQGQGDRQALLVRELDTGNPWQRFNSESTSWGAINAANNGELKINIFGPSANGPVGLYHWDGGADNENWTLPQETGQVTVDSVEYDLSKAVGDLGLPPSYCDATIVDNTLGGTPVTSTYALTRSVTTAHSFSSSESNTSGRKYTQTFSVEANIKKIVKISAKFSFEESDSTTTSTTSEDTSSNTVTDTVSTEVNVPAGKKYSYQVVVYYGKVSVPYTSKLTFKSSLPGAKPVPLTTKGVFTGVNKTRNEILIQDVTLSTPVVISNP